jgi:hypothetical protein
MRKRMTLKAKSELAEIFKSEYRGAGLKSKTQLLDAYTHATGLSRKHAISILRERVPSERQLRKRGRKSIFTAEDLDVLTKAWHLASCICSKRLVPFLPELLEELVKAGVPVSDSTSLLLHKVSARTVDRLLREERARYGRSLSTTKRGGLLKHQVPIHTFSDWNDVKPGFFEVDTVSHCASTVSGEFISSLNLTDVATGWTEPFALKSKTSKEVIAGFDQARLQAPFPILGLDCDNGKEFLNEAVIEWCLQKSVTFTRSREYKKNDQAWIEEKNKSVVRKHVGHARLEGLEACRVLKNYYSVLRLYINFFQPCQKLLLKERKGSKTYKKHDVAKTPYQRILDNPHVHAKDKARLVSLRSTLSMVALHEELFQIGEQLKTLAIYPSSPLAAALAAQRISTFKFISRPQINEQSSRSKTSMKPQNMAERIQMRMTLYPDGHTFGAVDFRDIAPRGIIDVYLKRWTQKKILTKVGWGKYRKCQQANNITKRSVG